MSRSLGHVTHVLLTRSRLCPRPKPGSSLHLHVLSTPPAFVLSQDQTLRESLAWFQIRPARGIPRNRSAPLSDHGKLSSRVSLPRTPAGPLNLTGTVSQAPHEFAEASPRGGQTWTRPIWSHVLLSFQRPRAPQGWGFHPAPVARRRSVALPNGRPTNSEPASLALSQPLEAPLPHLEHDAVELRGRHVQRTELLAVELDTSLREQAASLRA